MSLTQDQHRKLHAVRELIAGTGVFAFEKNGVFFLYRECHPRNQLVLHSKDVDDFVRRVKKAAGVK